MFQIGLTNYRLNFIPTFLYLSVIQMTMVLCFICTAAEYSVHIIANDLVHAVFVYIVCRYCVDGV